MSCAQNCNCCWDRGDEEANRMLLETSANVRLEDDKRHGKMTLKWIEGR
jgi:hypothetical protein